MASFVSILESTGNTAAGDDSTTELNKFTPHMGNLLILKITVNTAIAVPPTGRDDAVSDFGILDTDYTYEVLSVQLYAANGAQKFISNDTVQIDANGHVRFHVTDTAADAYAANQTIIGGTALAANDVITILLLSYKQGKIVCKEEPKEEYAEANAVEVTQVEPEVWLPVQPKVDPIDMMFAMQSDIMTEIADRFQKKLNAIQNQSGEMNPEEKRELQELQEMLKFINTYIKQWLQLKKLRSSLNLVQNNVNNFEVNISKIIAKLGIDDRLKIIDEIMKDDDTD